MADTPERFGIVPLSSVDLQVPLQDPSDLKTFSPDLLCMARQMQCPLPPRPVQQRPEQRLFTKLYYEKYRSLVAINFRQFAEDWNLHASVKNGVMPKLPVHLKLYCKQFLFNSRLKDASQRCLAAYRIEDGLGFARYERHLRRDADSNAAAHASC